LSSIVRTLSKIDRVRKHPKGYISALAQALEFIRDRDRKFPFFIVVDDGGFPYVNPKRRRQKIPIDAYETIVRLAKEFNTRIPVAFAMKYLDMHDVSGVGSPLHYAEELLALIRKNNDAIEVAFHGLTHDIGDKSEFGPTNEDVSVIEDRQYDHVEKSRDVCKSLGLSFPKIFVPPYHIWQPGVTDRIVASFGGKYIISMRKIVLGSRTYLFEGSDHMLFLPRLPIGIENEHTRLAADDLSLAKGILATDFRGIFKRFLPFSGSMAHSVMTHIGNFMPNNLSFWRELLKWIESNDKMAICKNNEEAVTTYRSIKQLSEDARLGLNPTHLST